MQRARKPQENPPLLAPPNVPELLQALAEKAAEQHIAMIQTPSGYTLAPMKDGEIITPQDFEALPEEEKRRTMEVIEELKEKLKVIV